MSNQEHLDILRSGANAWNQWRREKRVIVADLTRADLRGTNLAGVNLHRALLTDANCEGVTLVDANVSQANLTAANLTGANLMRADFSRANLNKAILNHADLDKAIFLAAKLTKCEIRDSSLIDSYFIDAKLTRASLNRSDLTKSNMTDSDLTRADLTGAILANAKLDRANLTSALLANTEFNNTDFNGTILNGIDISKSVGLESVNHRGPSTIDIDTIYLSNGVIPALFLRGVGVPETLITYLPSLTEQVLQFYSCFISYSHSDASFARRLHDALQGRGIRCWLDEHQLLPGDKIFAEVDRGIRLWDKVLLCCSEGSLTSWWVDNEIEIALAKEQQLWKTRGKEVLSLIPLNLDGYMFGDWASAKATQIKSRVAADFTGWDHDNEKFEAQFDKLVRALRANGGRERPPTPKL